MKKGYLIIFMAILMGSQAFPNDLDVLVKQGNAFYIDKEYERAAELYETVIDSGYYSAELYFNLGNAYFKQIVVVKFEPTW